jgi:hypothetical protein
MWPIMSKQTHLDPARRVIVAFGDGSLTKGVDAIAAITGRSRSRIYRWTYPESRGGTGGIIPIPQARRLLAEARRRKLTLTAADFLEAA